MLPSKKYIPYLIAASIGGVVGWCYWYFVGCNSGSCAITSNPVNATIYGVVMGGLLLLQFKK